MHPNSIINIFTDGGISIFTFCSFHIIKNDNNGNMQNKEDTGENKISANDMQSK